MFAGAESRSEKRAQLVLEKVGGSQVSVKTLERVLHDVGAELASLARLPCRFPRRRSPNAMTEMTLPKHARNGWSAPV